MKTCDLLADMPMFEALSRGQRERVAGIALEKAFAKGQVIFSDGEEAHGFYVATAGRVKVYKLSPEGKEQILHVFGVGEMFGEAAVFEGGRFPAYAEALGPCRALFFPREAFVQLVQTDPTLALQMLADLARRLRRFTRLVEDLSLKEVPGRLAAYLLYLSDRQDGADDVTLDLPKGQLASLLGTIPETLSRILARMTREGLIDSGQGRQLRILDRPDLEQLARGERRLA